MTFRAGSTTSVLPPPQPSQTSGADQSHMRLRASEEIRRPGRKAEPSWATERGGGAPVRKSEVSPTLTIHATLCTSFRGSAWLPSIGTLESPTTFVEQRQHSEAGTTRADAAGSRTGL